VRNTVKILGLLSVVAVVASFAVMATDRSEIQTPNLPDAAEGEMYDRTDIWPAPADGVQRPMPVSSNDGTSQPTSTRPGPIAGSEKLSFGVGSAIVSPRGGMVSTPQMRAEREIGKLIRQLD
jgi:hypothetical protein